MQNFQFYSASTVEDALAYLSDKGSRCKVIAGGTDVMPALRLESIQADYVLNILEIEELRGIEELDHAVRIGPTVTLAEIEESEVLNRHFPVLVEAAASVGGPQIRNRATIGGNIANASPCADVLPAVMALNGELELQSKSLGKRMLPLAEAIESPYKSRFMPHEILTGIIVPKLADGTRSVFRKVGSRNSLARSRMTLTVVLQTDAEERIHDLRVVPGAVMPTAKRMRKAENLLLGKKVEPRIVEASMEALAEEMVLVAGARWSTAYKVPVIKNLFRALLEELAQPMPAARAGAGSQP